MSKGGDTTTQFLQLRNRIATGDFSPIYLLHGAESYFIDEISNLLEKSILPEAERSFNQTILYGKDLKIQDLVSMARRYPMMSKYQVIIVKEAQNIKEWDKFEAYATQPAADTVLVICYKGSKFDSRTKTGKALAKHTVFLSDPLKEFQLKSWLPEYIKQKGKKIDSAAVELLIDYLGTDLTIVHNELEKLFITIKDDFITVGHIQQNVGQSRKYNVFELQKALGMRDFNASVQIANHMAADEDKGELIRSVPALQTYFSKVLQVQGMAGRSEKEISEATGINPFFLREYIAAARNYRPLDLEKVFNSLKYFDLRLKGVNRGSVEDGQLLIETVVNILKN